jgi:hypothetical protein
MWCAFARKLTITQLHEVFDTWETIRRGVGRKVCPSVSAVRGPGVSGRVTACRFFFRLDTYCY